MCHPHTSFRSGGGEGKVYSEGSGLYIFHYKVSYHYRKHSEHEQVMFVLIDYHESHAKLSTENISCTVHEQ